MSDENEKAFIGSRNETERVVNLGEYFRAYLHNWLSGLAEGVQLTPGVERELALALIEYACIVRLAKDELGNDDQNCDHAFRVSRELLDHLEREMSS